jgi:hypothetical protein
VCVSAHTYFFVCVCRERERERERNLAASLWLENEHTIPSSSEESTCIVVMNNDVLLLRFQPSVPEISR